MVEMFCVYTGDAFGRHQSININNYACLSINPKNRCLVPDARSLFKNQKRLDLFKNCAKPTTKSKIMKYGSD